MNRIDLQNRIAIVTGGAKGIGFAIAQRFLQSGARCLIWDIDRPALGAALECLRAIGPAEGDEVDVRNPDAVEAAAARALERHGAIDILVNNAGIAGPSKKTWECAAEEWRGVIELDLVAVFYCCKAVVPRMLRNDYGRIVNIASIAGKEGNPNASHYSAAKAGLIGFTKSLGKELARTGVRVNCITPAVIDTDILKQITAEHIDYMVSKIPMGRLGKKEEAAAMAAWLASEECSFSTGAVFDLSGGRATY